jgi:hypothetical protein
MTLTRFEHLRSRLSPTALLLFWLTTTISNAIALRTSILSGNNLGKGPQFMDFVFFATAFSFSLVAFILECFPKSNDGYTQIDQDENPCPEVTANIFSRFAFHWIDPLMKLGYSKELEMEDLW